MTLIGDVRCWHTTVSFWHTEEPGSRIVRPFSQFESFAAFRWAALRVGRGLSWLRDGQAAAATAAGSELSVFNEAIFDGLVGCVVPAEDLPERLVAGFATVFAQHGKEPFALLLGDRHNGTKW